MSHAIANIVCIVIIVGCLVGLIDQIMIAFDYLFGHNKERR